MTRSKRSSWIPVAVFLLSAAMGGNAGGPSPAYGSDELPVIIEHLPDTNLFCSLVGQENSLLDSLKGKPAVIFVTDIESGADNPLGRMVGELQEKYFYWFTWAGLLVGEAEPEQIGEMHRSAPFRLERCFGDRERTVWQSLEIYSLPALLFVNDSGYVVRRIKDSDIERKTEIFSALDSLVRTAGLEGTSIRDFKLPDLKTGELFSLLDVSRKDYTMFIFLHTENVSCMLELQLLQHVKDRFGDVVQLVAVLLDQSEEKHARAYLDMYGARPEFVLRDPTLWLAKAYSFQYVPVMFVVGPEGKIVYAKKGYQPDTSWNLSQDLSRLFTENRTGGEETRFQEINRIHDEALQYIAEGKPDMALFFLERIIELNPELTTVHSLIADAYWETGNHREAARHYGRYLSANPYAYDLGRIKERLRISLGTGR